MKELWKLEEQKYDLESKASPLEHSNEQVREALRTVQDERDIAQQKEEQSRGGVDLSKGKAAASLVKRAEMLVCCIPSQAKSPGACGERGLMKSEVSPWDFEAMDIKNEKLATQP